MSNVIDSVSYDQYKNIPTADEMGVNTKIIFNEEIKIDEIKEIFFKDELGVYFSRGGGLGDKRKFLKIKTSYKIFSFGILIENEEYKKIRAVIKEKLKI